jgi:GTPase SAR1 family protein
MSETKKNICSNPECNITETGKCVEGFPDLADCPYYGKELKETKAALNEDAASSSTHLSTGDALNIEQANKVLSKYSTKVIAVVGPVNSGKTTLISSLYDVFQKGSFKGYSFTGSRTIPAFERMCHLARAVSNRSLPSVERTSRSSGLKFFHLGLSNTNTNKVELLLSDRSGEDYESATDKTEFCSELKELVRADLVLILVDGKNISDRKLRQSVVTRIKLLLQALFEGGMIDAKHRIGIVLTKYDLVKSDENNGGSSDSIFESLSDWINENFSEKFMEIFSIKIAARPESNEMEAGYGLDGLFNRCFQEKVILKHQVLRKVSATRAYHHGPKIFGEK